VGVVEGSGDVGKWPGSVISSPGLCGVCLSRERSLPMVGVILFLVIAGVAIRVVYGLGRPPFWLFSAVVVLIGLPFVLLLMVAGPLFR
jgi:hypothetical protein